ncbi:MAG TPA: TolC family protein [Candidatus Acidoferrales bacterium]|jgi:outer membrane protein|nr:TolC family protein [Candidatus Acidoferrales bacterium]
MIGRLHVAVVLLTAASLVISPAYAEAQQGQDQNQAQQQQQGQAPGGTQPPSQPQAQTGAPATEPARDLRDVEGPDYSRPKRALPVVWDPYTPQDVPEPMLTNSSRIDQLIQDGKLMLSLDDAISLALENNLNINVTRFIPWIAQTQLLKAKAGGIPQSSSTQQVVLGSSPSVSFDPIATANFGWSHANVPINNPFTSGAGTTAIPLVQQNSGFVNLGYTQGFHTGTNFSVTFDTTRSSTNLSDVVFNPALNPIMTATLSQPLLNGFGLLPNTRYIIEARNSIKVANSQFAQQVIATVTQTSNDYWELVYDRENVKVQEAAVGVSQKLYQDNKKQLEIGTMAPLDVLTAESQLATDQQNLIVAQTTRLQQETVLLNDITKNLLAKDVAGIEIIPTTGISTPDLVENIPLQDAVQEAWKKRPELYQADLNLKNAGIEVKATANGLLPSLNAYVQYQAQGLNGNRIKTNATGGFAADTASPLVDANGNILLVNGTQAFAAFPVTATTIVPGGLGNSLGNVFHNDFPTYAVGVNLTLPIRNRSAQADSARAQLDERQERVQYRQTENTIVLNVRNALIALQQDRAQVAAADKARTLAQQTLDAEQKKYQLGSSTSYQVVLRSRDLTAAQGTALRAQANLTEALVNFNQAMGRTLEVNHITVADALRGTTGRDPLIPGTPVGDVGMGAK